MNAPEVWQLCPAKAHNESERFELRSHDYNNKYLRFRYSDSSSNKLFYLLIMIGDVCVFAAVAATAASIHSISISRKCSKSESFVNLHQFNSIFSSFKIDNERKLSTAINHKLNNFRKWPCRSFILMLNFIKVKSRRIDSRYDLLMLLCIQTVILSCGFCRFWTHTHTLREI